MDAQDCNAPLFISLANLKREAPNFIIYSGQLSRENRMILKVKLKMESLLTVVKRKF